MNKQVFDREANSLTFVLTQEQAEALIQIQMQATILDNFLVMGKHMDADRHTDDYLELGADELEDLAQGEYTILQLWSK